MELDIVMLSEMTETQKDKYHMLPFAYEKLELKNKDMKVE
jgi:hypothetical protein